MIKLRRRVYIGSDTRLSGKTALVRKCPFNQQNLWMAQFDDLNLGEAYGWWAYPKSAFARVPRARKL